MAELGNKISENLLVLSDIEFQKALDFIEFLIWKGRNTRTVAPPENDVVTTEDRTWLETDVSHLGHYDPYDWQPGEREEGTAVSVVPRERIFADWDVLDLGQSRAVEQKVLNLIDEQ